MQSWRCGEEQGINTQSKKDSVSWDTETLFSDLMPTVLEIQDSERGACAGEEEKVGGTYQGWNGNFSGIILLGLQGRREQEGYWPWQWITGWSYTCLSSKEQIQGTAAEKTPGTEDLHPLRVARNNLWHSASLHLNKWKNKESTMNGWSVGLRFSLLAYTCVILLPVILCALGWFLNIWIFTE